MLLASSWERPRHAARHRIMHRRSSPFPPAKTHPEQCSWGWETLLWVPGTLTFSPKQPISRVCSSHHLVTCEWLFERDVGKPWVCGMGCPHASVRPPPHRCLGWMRRQWLSGQLSHVPTWISQEAEDPPLQLGLPSCYEGTSVKVRW